MKCLLIGCGRMGSAILKGILKNEYREENFSIIDPKSVVDPVIKASKVKIYKNLDEILIKDRTFKLVIFAVKPQIINEVVKACKEKLKGSYLLISIVAGVKINFYQSALKKNYRIIRAMPNIPAEIGKGITALVKSRNISKKDMDISKRIFGPLGEILWIKEEKHMDLITAISGSGPAYIFYLAEIMIKLAIDKGLSKKEASLLVSQMIKGSGSLMNLSPKTAKELRDEVTSPGGTTESALKVIMLDETFAKIMRKAILSAMQRSKELSNQY